MARDRMQTGFPFRLRIRVKQNRPPLSGHTCVVRPARPFRARETGSLRQRPTVGRSSGIASSEGSGSPSDKPTAGAGTMPPRSPQEGLPEKPLKCFTPNQVGRMDRSRIKENTRRSHGRRRTTRP